MAVSGQRQGRKDPASLILCRGTSEILYIGISAWIWTFRGFVLQAKLKQWDYAIIRAVGMVQAAMQG